MAIHIKERLDNICVVITIFVFCENTACLNHQLITLVATYCVGVIHHRSGIVAVVLRLKLLIADAAGHSLHLALVLDCGHFGCFSVVVCCPFRSETADPFWRTRIITIFTF